MEILNKGEQKHIHRTFITHIIEIQVCTYNAKIKELIALRINPLKFNLLFYSITMITY